MSTFSKFAPRSFSRSGRLGFVRAPLEWYACRLTAAFRVLPNFIIIGSQKCGTSSLCTQLFEHPQILPARTKEVHYFDTADYDQGPGWYRAHFPRRSKLPKGSVTGEASPFYVFHPHTPARSHALVPKAKIILMLRNPVNRALSHYHHQVRQERESLSFEEALALEEERLEGEYERILANPSYYSYNYWAYSYKARGRYAEQLANWYKYFDKEQLLVISSEEYFADTQEQYLRTLRFIGVEEIQLSKYHKANTGEYDLIDDVIKDQLSEYFRPHNQELYELINRDLGW